jgi:hypothetical protein
MRVSQRIYLLFLAFFLTTIPLYGQRQKQIDFKAQPVADILSGLGRLMNKSVVVDETITGTSSLFMIDADPEIAFRTFLEMNMFYSKEKNGLIKVTAVRLIFEPLKN